MGNDLKTIYFIIHPMCKYLNPEMKIQILNQVERKDKNERMNFLFDQITTYFLEMENEAKLSTSKIVTFLKSLKIRECFVLIVVVLNMFILFFMKSEIKNNKLTPKKFDFEYGDTIL